jgi:hypothetical protein
MNPLIPLGAVATGLAAYFLLKEEDCYDDNLDPKLRALAVKLLAPETGNEKLSDLIARTRHMRTAAGIAKKKNHPKLGACLLERAEQLEAVIRKTGGKPGAALPGKQPVKGAKGATPPPSGVRLGVTTVEHVPTKKPGKAPPAGGKAAPFGSFKLPAGHGPAREKAILEAVKAGKLRPWQMLPVDCSRGGVQCTVYVSNDAVALGDAAEFVRVNVTHPTAERIAIELGAHLPTTRIADLAWQQANTRLEPHIFPAGPEMASTLSMYKHNAAVEKERAGRGGLVRPVGKSWVTSNRIVGKPDKATNYGWHTKKYPSKYLSGPAERKGKIRVIQPLSTFHTWPHTDYSQTVTLVSNVATVNGKTMKLADLMRHPTLSQVVSDEGPLRAVRHPHVESIDDEAGGGLVA